ncbi:hypothetical protein JIG36_36170 [Actinoplanes sp. LDG1-06]|uniref:Uncharacterized protein n=1 Tax=Paractinoplanes ovalisporus TaxID=2810368 RepID=A0ABS2AMB5_9ACTN|nr:hypothetical protein [Actinoplanes ovalisporus]MBM2620950.1 hypothetical protein [Actinoplanes ovalisporus]
MFEVKLGGYEQDDPEDPFLIGAPMWDLPQIVGPLIKDRREDMQVYSVLKAMSVAGFARNPLTVEVGQDPPDRWLVHADRRWAAELTELTIQDVRQTVAPPRMFARTLSARLNAELDRYAHLRDRLVLLSCDEGAIPRRPAALLDEIAQLLTTDIGFVGEGIDLSSGPPETLPMDRGFHGDHGPFSITVQQGVADGAVVVSASTPTNIKRSEAIAALVARVLDKDVPSNEVLLVTCGAPDPQGYVCSVDSSIFQLLRDSHLAGVNILEGMVPLQHLQSVVLHMWNTDQLVIFGANEDLPWKPVQRETA